MHQYLFFIGDFPIRMYGLMLCTAIFLATGTAYFLAKQDGRWHEHILDIGIYGGFAGLIGGRLWDVFFFDWDYYSHHLLEIPFVWQGGMAVQGGMLAGIAAGIVYCKMHDIDWRISFRLLCLSANPSDAWPTCSTAMPSAHLPAAASVFCTRKARWPTKPTAPYPCGRQRFGKVSWTSSFLPCCCCSAPPSMRAVRLYACTLCFIP